MRALSNLTTTRPCRFFSPTPLSLSCSVLEASINSPYGLGFRVHGLGFRVSTLKLAGSGCAKSLTGFIEGLRSPQSSLNPKL